MTNDETIWRKVMAEYLRRIAARIENDTEALRVKEMVIFVHHATDESDGSCRTDTAGWFHGRSLHLVSPMTYRVAEIIDAVCDNSDADATADEARGGTWTCPEVKEIAKEMGLDLSATESTGEA